MIRNLTSQVDWDRHPEARYRRNAFVAAKMLMLSIKKEPNDEVEELASDLQHPWHVCSRPIVEPSCDGIDDNC